MKIREIIIETSDLSANDTPTVDEIYKTLEHLTFQKDQVLMLRNSIQSMVKNNLFNSGYLNVSLMNSINSHGIRISSFINRVQMIIDILDKVSDLHPTEREQLKIKFKNLLNK